MTYVVLMAWEYDGYDERSQRKHNPHWNPSMRITILFQRCISRISGQKVSWSCSIELLSIQSRPKIPRFWNLSELGLAYGPRSICFLFRCDDFSCVESRWGRIPKNSIVIEKVYIGLVRDYHPQHQWIAAWKTRPTPSLATLVVIPMHRWIKPVQANYLDVMMIPTPSK
jgi:hypothetical protein